MKRLFIFLAVVLLTVTIWAQSPQKMSYQAVIRDANNHLVTTQVAMRITILLGPLTPGTEVYVERQITTPNANGLVTIEINGPMVTHDFGTFGGIDWPAGEYYIKTETDINPGDGSNYTITGTSQLLSVPFALHAKTAETTAEIDPVFSSWDKNYDDLKNRPSAISDFTMNANSQNIINLAAPVNEQDAATKAYVDALLARIEDLEILHNGFLDSRDGNYYNAVRIGNQIWMADNLKYLPSISGPGTGSTTNPYYYVYDYDGAILNDAKATSSYITYGVLYNWPAAMNGAASSTSNPSGVQGACPTGWHLPSDAELTQLTNYLGGESVAGGKLKETGTVHWLDPNLGATNETFFTALPGGYRNGDGTFDGVFKYCELWSTTDFSDTNAFGRIIWYTGSNVSRSSFNKSLGFSIRCLRD